MKKTYYEVFLKGYRTKVWAFSQEQATILAQAYAITEGRDYTFVSIKILA